MPGPLPTVVVIDDSTEVRAVITARLRLSGLLEVVGEGGDGTEAVGLAFRHQPSLLLLDLSMPVMDGLDALPGILAVSPDTRVVVYSGFEEGGLAQSAQELGAAGFIEKSLPIDRLAEELLAKLPEHHAPQHHAPSAPRERPVRSSTGSDQPTVSSDQQVLDEHLERFREVFEQAAIGMATMTLTGSIVRANRALSDLMGFKPHELVGLDYGRLTSGRGDLLDAALFDITHMSADIVHLEHDINGSIDPPRKVLATLAPVRDSRGQALYVFLQVQDITRQRAAEEELRRSEERFRLLVEAVRDYAIFMLDPYGHVASWNAGAERIKGYTASEIIGQHFRVFYPGEKREEQHPEYELQQALRTGQYGEEGWRLRKDGTRFWANVLITAVFNEMGEHIGFAKVTRDMTERRQAEELRAAASAALEEANEQLRRAAEEQKQFLAVTAHELRTPAAVLDGTADTLRRHWAELTDDDRTRLLDSMSSSAARLQRLVNDLMTASRLDADSLPLRQAATSLAVLVATAIETVRATRPGGPITTQLEPDVDVLVDPGRVVQVIENLVGNALHHGTPPVDVRIGAGDDVARVEITDAGQGVPPEVRERLFQRFSTGDGVHGTGLGLYIARELARAHGGDVSYEPGTPERPAGTFVLTLPLAPG
ncbi:PAS domain S-box protein [Jiangella rhizosphaerae]|uniref:histidine kinase n=1 Tax=Jiangella rhizosphaerae TaxID=2293569 RepID=A0A418KLD7_9ACTN|nr:PAS domain S-box protein [Jiangella rhizosphaerae]RIQ18338.1 PAS domain S-box protein [Jiangella rhizosphaerae]